MGQALIIDTGAPEDHAPALKNTSAEIADGSEADIVVFDPKSTSTISAKTHHMATDYSAFEGRSVLGKIRDVTVRGRFVVRSGALVVGEGGGRYLARPCTH
jgi:dihydropyrimidinase